MIILLTSDFILLTICPHFQLIIRAIPSFVLRVLQLLKKNSWVDPTALSSRDVIAAVESSFVSVRVLHVGEILWAVRQYESEIVTAPRAFLRVWRVVEMRE